MTMMKKTMAVGEIVVAWLMALMVVVQMMKMVVVQMMMVLWLGSGWDSFDRGNDNDDAKMRGDGDKIGDCDDDDE